MTQIKTNDIANILHKRTLLRSM